MSTQPATGVFRTAPTPQRLVSLDQFRGYTVVGMLLVNFVGGYQVCPQVLKHSHDYCSYADTIMPQFLFAVGFALRLSFGRRMQTQGSLAAYGRMIRRLLGLVLISLVVYNVSPPAATWEQLTELGVWGAIRDPLKRQWFQTLMHIAVTSLWILPVVHAGWTLRILWGIASAGAHVVLSHLFYFSWVQTSPAGIDGGPLGFLTWSIPALVGTMACDVFVRPGQTSPVAGGSVWRVALTAGLFIGCGYLLSCGTRFYDVAQPSTSHPVTTAKLAESPVWPTPSQIAHLQAQKNPSAWLAEPPFVPPPSSAQRQWNYWMMSQRAGTLTYLTYSAGISLAVYLLFYIACDIYGWQSAFFRTFGTNALIAYILHGLVSSALQPFVPKDAPGWYVSASLVLFFSINWLFVRQLEKQNIFVRV